MPQKKLEIRTEDGSCPSYVFQPDGAGPWPAVLVFMDGVGIRPAMLEVGERISRAGYFVLLPDLYYRAGPYEPMDPKVVFGNPDALKALRAKFMSTTNSANVMRDTRAFLAFLSAQPEVQGLKIGTTGYCMGGRFSLQAAGNYPNRVAAAASYHGANLANDAEDSPHLLAPKMKARVYVAGAIEDGSFPEEQKVRLEKALTDARVEHVVETYPAKHGWTLSDTPVHDPAQAERHYQTMLALFERTLRA